jgi:hypothetical protein
VRQTGWLTLAEELYERDAFCDVEDGGGSHICERIVGCYVEEDVRKWWRSVGRSRFRERLERGELAKTRCPDGSSNAERPRARCYALKGVAETDRYDRLAI